MSLYNQKQVKIINPRVKLYAVLLGPGLHKGHVKVLAVIGQDKIHLTESFQGFFDNLFLIIRAVSKILYDFRTASADHQNA